MSGADEGWPRVLSQVPGRLRLHLPGWQGEGADRIEARLREVHGVRAVRANPLTGNVLVRFDPHTAGTPAILAALPAPSEMAADPGGEVAAPAWLRVGVRGLLGHAAVDTLWFGVGLLGQAAGLPLAWLGPVHLLTDALVWGAALASARTKAHPAGP